MTFLKNVHPLDNSRDLVIHSMTYDQETKIQGIQGIMEFRVLWSMIEDQQ